MNELNEFKHFQRQDPLLRKLAKFFTSYSATLASLTQPINALQNSLQPTRSLVETFDIWGWVRTVSTDSGYLPHRTIPFREFYLECRPNYNQFLSHVLRYYETHEENILQTIESYLETREDIDTDRKETLQETINAHRCRWFRLTTPTLLPLIERVILEDWLGKEKGEVTQLSKKQLNEATAHTGVSNFTPDNIYDLQLLRCLTDVLYENGSKLEHFKQSPSPNRHAALHGWVHYSSKETSLSIIILAEYTLRLPHIIAARKPK